MKLAILYRFALDPTGKRSRLYIPKEFVDVFNKLNVLLLPIVSDTNLDEFVEMCDGLIVPGSYQDVNPSYYNELPLKGKTYDIDEYGFDSRIISLFLKANKPILGICAGLQELNVYFGGTLNQYIENHSDNIHSINIKKDTFIYDVFNSDKANVNSLHHQCIKDVAKGFVVSAISDDGIVEAIEKDNIVAVQWHPEVMNDLNFFKVYLDKYF